MKKTNPAIKQVEELAEIVFYADNAISKFDLYTNLYIHPNFLSIENEQVDYHTDKIESMFNMFMQIVEKYGFYNRVEISLKTKSASVSLFNFSHIFTLYHNEQGKEILGMLMRQYYDNFKS